MGQSFPFSLCCSLLSSLRPRLTPAGWPYSLPSLSLLPEDAFESQRSVFWKAIFPHPCIPDVSQGFALGVESLLSHLSAPPRYLTPAPAIVMGSASHLFCNSSGVL